MQLSLLTIWYSQSGCVKIPGFRPVRSCRNHNFILRQMSAQSYFPQARCLHVTVTLSSVDREVLWHYWMMDQRSLFFFFVLLVRTTGAEIVLMKKLSFLFTTKGLWKSSCSRLSTVRNVSFWRTICEQKRMNRISQSLEGTCSIFVPLVSIKQLPAARECRAKPFCLTEHLCGYCSYCIYTNNIYT